MATARVAPEFHPGTQEILNALGFKIQTYQCHFCAKRVIIEVVLAGESFSELDSNIRYMCPECAELKRDFS